MIHDEMREARIAAGLSVMELAKRAKVPRQRVYEMEKGGNVTLETLRRIAAALPNLQRVTLGGMEIVTANADLEEARRAALDLFDVAKRLMSALGASGPAHTSIGAVRYGGSTEDDRQAAERIERMVLKERKHPARKHN